MSVIRIENKIEDERLKEEIIRQIAKKEWIKGRKCLYDKRYMECVYDIINSEPFERMNNYIQHGTTTTLEHCLSVSYISYKICKYYNFDYISAARGGLLHDLFLYDWHTHRKETGNRFHGFTHPVVALHNAEKYFKLNDVEKDIIKKHMWPLTVVPPKTREGFVVMYADKYCGLIETMERVKNNLTFLDSFVKMH